MNLWKTPSQRALVGDSYSAISIETLGNSDSMIYGRHFAKPYYPSPIAWSSGMGYRTHGSGSANWMMMDGSVKNWTWLSFYQQYPPSSGATATSANNPFQRIWAQNQ